MEVHFKAIDEDGSTWRVGTTQERAFQSMGSLLTINTYDSYETEYYYVKRGTLCHSVGREDVNGVDIFFNDIVEEDTLFLHKVKGKVVYINGVVCIDNFLQPLWNYNVKVVGNIHDNELENK